jgi:hypothetical protein
MGGTTGKKRVEKKMVTLKPKPRPKPKAKPKGLSKADLIRLAVGG